MRLIEPQPDRDSRGHTDVKRHKLCGNAGMDADPQPLDPGDH